MRSVDNKTLTEAKAAIQSSYTLSMIMPRHPSLYKDLDFGRNDRYGERVFKMVSTYPFNLKYMHAQKYTIVKMDECRKFTAIMVPIASDGDKGALFITADIDKYGYTNFNEQLFTSDGELLIEKAETVRLKKEQRDLIETVADIMYDVLTKPVLKVKKVATATEKEADRIDEIYRTKGENAANKARVNAEAKELSTWPGVKVYCQATYTPNKRYYMSSDSTKKHARKCYEVLKRVGNQLHSIMDKVDFKDIIIDKSVCAKLICKPILQIGCTSITGQNANIDVDLITKLQLTNKADVLFSTFGEFCWPDNPSEYDLDMVEIYNRRLKALGMTDSERGIFHAPANCIVQGAVGLSKRITQSETELLYDKNINILKYFPGSGVKIWGAKTLAPEYEWRYISVRRTFSRISAAIKQGTQWAVFEINDKNLRKRLVRQVSGFLLDLWMKGYLAGSTSEQGFYVRCDEELNPIENIDNGILTFEVGIAIVKPAEFFQVTITAEKDGASVYIQED